MHFIFIVPLCVSFPKKELCKESQSCFQAKLSFSSLLACNEYKRYSLLLVLQAVLNLIQITFHFKFLFNLASCKPSNTTFKYTHPRLSLVFKCGPTCSRNPNFHSIYLLAGIFKIPAFNRTFL